MTRVVALVVDLMDRSRLSDTGLDVVFATDIDAAQASARVAPADVVVVDLSRHDVDLAAVRAAFPDARIVGFGPHVDTERAVDARAAGIDLVLPRSRFFRDPAAALAIAPEPT